MKKYVQILCDDIKFSRMLSLELFEIGVETVAKLDATDDLSEYFVLADLDSVSKELIESLHPNIRVFGFTKDPNKEKEFGPYCNSTLRRPFLNSALLSLFGYTEKNIKSNRTFRTEKKVLNINKLTLDQKNQSAIWGDEIIALSENEFKVLSLLCHNRGETVKRETIDMALGADESNIGDVYICHLRKKLDNKLGLKLIYTIRGKGYMLKN